MQSQWPVMRCATYLSRKIVIAALSAFKSPCSNYVNLILNILHLNHVTQQVSVVQCCDGKCHIISKANGWNGGKRQGKAGCLFMSSDIECGLNKNEERESERRQKTF